MKKITGFFKALATVGMCLLICGCVTSRGTTVEKEYDTFRVEENSLFLNNYIKVRERMVERVNDLLKVQIRGQNVSSKDVQFEYRFVWLDGGGFQIDTGTSMWKPLNLHAREYAFMKGIAPTPAAVDFLMTVRFVRSASRW